MQQGDKALPDPGTADSRGEAGPSRADHASLAHASLDLLYQHAGEWVRMTNTLIWTIGTLFVPAAFFILGYTVRNVPSHSSQVLAAVGSLALFSSWVYISRLYGESSSIARSVLMRVEENWNLPRDLAFYTLQDPVVKRGPMGWNLRAVQRLLLGILAVCWLVVLFANALEIDL